MQQCVTDVSRTCKNKNALSFNLTRTTRTIPLSKKWTLLIYLLLFINFPNSYLADSLTSLYYNGCRIYADIMTVKFLSIQIAVYPVTYWSVRLSCRSGGDGEIATTFTLLENTKIWCKIQVIINPFFTSQENGIIHL